MASEIGAPSNNSTMIESTADNTAGTQDDLMLSSCNMHVKKGKKTKQEEKQPAVQRKIPKMVASNDRYCEGKRDVIVRNNQGGNIAGGDITIYNYGLTANNDDPSETYRLEIKFEQFKFALNEEIDKITCLEEDESLSLAVAKQSQPPLEKFGRKAWFDESSQENEVEVYNMYELFQKCFVSSKTRADEICTTQKSKQLYMKKHGAIVAAVGIAGIGKTTMEKLLVHHTKLNSPCQSPPLIFFVSLRDIADFTKPCTVLEFLTSSTLADWDHTHESDKALLKKINETDDIHLYIDALDEARGMNLKDDAPRMKLFEKATPDVIFKNLCLGHLLPKAKKFLTSRPGAFHNLNPLYKPDFSVTVLGLTKEAQERLCFLISGDTDDAKKVKKMFDSNATLSSLCFIPMFCKMTVKYLLENLTSFSALNSSTDLFVYFLDQFVGSQHFKGQPDDILNVAQLALDGFVTGQLMFEIKDLKAAAVDESWLGAFTNTVIVGKRNLRLKIFDGYKRFYFSHLLWQEFFSALQLMFGLTLDQFNNMKEHFSEDRWESVVKFLFGLANPGVVEKLKLTFSNVLDVDCSKKCDALKNFLKSSMEVYQTNTLSDVPPVATASDLSRMSERLNALFMREDFRLFKICAWAYELQDDDLTSFVAAQLPDDILLRGSILPSDVTCLCHVLSKTLKKRNISVGTFDKEAAFVGEGLEILLHNLKTTNHKLKKLIVKNQVTSTSNIIHFFHDISEARIDIGNLSSVELQEMFKALARRIVPIDILGLHGKGDISAAGEELVSCLPKIEMLTLPRCGVGEEFLRKLATAIKHLPSPMKWFELNGEELTRTSVADLAGCIHNIQSLKLVDCKLKGDDMEELADKIANMDEPLKRLNLRVNEIGSAGAKYLLRCIHNIQSLDLLDCQLNSDDVVLLADKIRTLDKPLKWLNLNKNLIGPTGVQRLCRCISNVQRLCLEKCQLTGEDIEMMANAILQREQPMQSLFIARNKFEDRGAFALSCCLHKINDITLAKCNLSRCGIEKLREKNAENDQKCAMRGLDDQDEDDEGQ